MSSRDLFWSPRNVENIKNLRIVHSVAMSFHDEADAEISAGSYSSICSSRQYVSITVF